MPVAGSSGLDLPRLGTQPARHKCFLGVSIYTCVCGDKERTFISPFYDSTARVYFQSVLMMVVGPGGRG